MKIQTALFGEVEVSAEKVITFPAGLPGFPGLNRFVILPVAGTAGQVEWLQAVDDPGVGVPVLDPAPFFPEYQPTWDGADGHTIGLQSPADGVVRVVASIPGEVKEMTANLRAPLLFNPFSRQGCQVVLADERFSVRQPVFVEGGAPDARHRSQSR